MSANTKVNTSPEEVGATFWTDMESHARDPVDDSAPSVFFGPKEYSKLSPEELAYYLRWRHQLSKGKMEKAVPGCIWLRVAEIADSRDMTLKDAEREIEVMRKGSKGSKLPFDLSSIIADLRISRGMPVDMDCARELGPRCVGTLSLESPPMPMSMYDIADLAGEPLTDPSKYEDKRFSELINKSIAKLDFYLRTTKSAGLAENHARREDWGHRVFEGFPYRGERNHAVPLFQFGLLGRILLGIVRNTERNVYGMDVKVPTELDGGMRSMVRSVYDNPKTAVEEGSPKGRELQFKVTRELVTEAVAQKSAGVATSSDTSYPRAEPVSAEGVVRPLMDVDPAPRSPRFMTEIRLNWTSDYTTEIPYTPSNSPTPDYSSMSQSQRRYYLHWRGRMRQGVYLDTDPGYIWLYACEVVNLEPEKSVVLDVLGEVSRRYPYSDSSDRHGLNFVQRVYQDYAVLHGLTAVDPSAAVSEYTLCHGFRRMLDGEIGFTPQVYAALGEVRESVMTADLDDDCARVLDKVLRWIDADDIWGIISNNAGGTVSVAYKVFEGVEYAVPDDRREVRVELPDIIRNKAFRESMNHIVKDVIRAVRKHNGRRNQRMSGEVCLGRLRGDLIEDMTEVWFWEKNRPPEPEPDHEDRRDRSRRKSEKRRREDPEDDRGRGRRDRRDRSRDNREGSGENRSKRTFKTEGFEEGGSEDESSKESHVEERPGRRDRRNRRSEEKPESRAAESEDREDKPKRERRDRRDRSRRDRGREDSDDGTDRPDVVETGDKPEEPVPEEKPKRTRRSRKTEESEAKAEEAVPDTVPEPGEKPKRTRRSKKDETAQGIKDEPAPGVESVGEKPKRSRKSKKTEESVPETKAEEPVREEKPEKNPGGSGSDDPQASFLKAVTPMQREYIGMILANEDTTEFLKAKRKSVKWMETALNNVAGKTLGENVVLDGRPVDKWKTLLGKVKRS